MPGQICGLLARCDIWPNLRIWRESMQVVTLVLRVQQ